MWPVTIETTISVIPPTPVKCPIGATRAEMKLTRARVLILMPVVAAWTAPGGAGTELDGAVCWPAICVTVVVGACVAGGGGRSLEGVLKIDPSLTFD
jgi:hypothetical protein